MGAGKSTLGRALADALGRRFVDTDAVVEERTGSSIEELMRTLTFRDHEERVVIECLEACDPAVIALGGGAILTPGVRPALRQRALTVLLHVDPEEAWHRVEGSVRPLAKNRDEFLRLFEERWPQYVDASDAQVEDLDGAILAAAGAHVETGALERLGELVPGGGAVEIVADARVAGIHGMDAQLALGGRARGLHELPPGEAAKSVESLQALWHGLRLERGGTLLALGGGCTTDVAGFAAATFMRGIAWVAVPTTLVGQVDAAIGGKTAVDLPDAKNLVGAFHWPVRTVIDPALLETLPEPEMLNGRAEVVKTGLLAGEPFWELPLPEQVRRCAAFKAAVCLRDPEDRGERAQLNLGHTFAHALETASGFELPHGRAVALGLLAALRLSGLDTKPVEEALRPERVRVDRDTAWAAMARDKKVVGGVPRLVLLEEVGKPRVGVELPAEDVRKALNELIAG